jgi:alkanesulfonate monooxygenase SsuD/methylene tetrahydromethanopterin reductase-like flavin-dependent oxidoreductase (luciferase family)
LHVGGESPAALRRAAVHGDGWFGLEHTPESVAEQIARLRAFRIEAGRADAPFEVTISSTPRSAAELEAFEAVGVDRVVVAPWKRSRESLDAIRSFASQFVSEAPASQ